MFNTKVKFKFEGGVRGRQHISDQDVEPLLTLHKRLCDSLVRVQRHWRNAKNSLRGAVPTSPPISTIAACTCASLWQAR